MALIKCPKCRNWIGENMDNCPQCGLARDDIDMQSVETLGGNISYKPLREGKKVIEKGSKHSEKGNIIFISFILLIVFLIILINNNSSVSNNSDYIVISEHIIDNRLKAPITAKYSTIKVENNKNDVITSGYVDADNSFGAKIRTYFTITFYGGDLDNYSVVIN